MTSVINAFCNLFSIKSLSSSSEIENQDILKIIPHFGAEEWKTCLNIEVKNAPEIPKELQERCSHDCPYTPGKSVAESHMLCLIISKTLNEIREKMQQSAHPYSEHLVVPKQPYWILITKKVMPNTERLLDPSRCAPIAEGDYQLPTVLEAGTAVLAAKYLGNVRLFEKQQTKCIENVDGRPLVVGFDPYVGFSVARDRFQQCGVAGVIRSTPS